MRTLYREGFLRYQVIKSKGGAPFVTESFWGLYELKTSLQNTMPTIGLQPYLVPGNGFNG